MTPSLLLARDAAERDAAIARGDAAVLRATGVCVARVLADACEFDASALELPMANLTRAQVIHFQQFCLAIDAAADGADVGAIARAFVERVDASARDQHATLVALADMANYLNAPALLDACLAQLAAAITGKTPLELAREFAV